LVKHRLTKNVKYDVKNGVVTLTGDVPSQTKREQVKNSSPSVPNVKQVVNELEVKNQKASSDELSGILAPKTRSQLGRDHPSWLSFLIRFRAATASHSRLSTRVPTQTIGTSEPKET